LTEAIGGKPIHPSNALPGGMSAPLTAAKRAELATMADEALRIALEGWDIARTLLDGVDTEFGAVRTGFMGMTNHGVYSTYDGPVAVLNGEGGRIGSFTGTDYTKFIEEYSEDWSYLKFVRLKGGGELPCRAACQAEHRGEDGHGACRRCACGVSRAVRNSLTGSARLQPGALR